jgi:hypothetical protein
VIEKEPPASLPTMRLQLQTAPGFLAVLRVAKPLHLAKLLGSREIVTATLLTGVRLTVTVTDRGAPDRHCY